MSLDTVLDLLRCPHCGCGLTRRGTSVVCEHGHSFDPARQGYLNLLGTPQPRHADTAAMVAAREAFHATDAFDAVTSALAQLPIADDASIADCGAGPGSYLAAIVNAATRRRGVAIDISVAACRRAARVHPRVGSVVADAWQALPLGEACVDVVLSIFAPRNGAEFARVLRPGGEVVVITPLDDHLIELREPLGLLAIDPAKDRRLDATLSSFDLITSETMITTRAWDASTAGLAASMGPTAFHTDATTIRQRIDALSWPHRVTVSCRLTRWRQQ